MIIKKGFNYLRENGLKDTFKIILFKYFKQVRPPIPNPIITILGLTLDFNLLNKKITFSFSCFEFHLQLHKLFCHQ